MLQTPEPAGRWSGKPIVLIGLMGAGKTTVGRRLAQRMRLPFVDADHEIEAAAGMSVADIFERFGEPYFRDGERRVISRLVDGAPKVIATGGGAFMNEGTRALILERGIAVWLDAEPEVLADRVRRRDTRPLLRGRDPVTIVPVALGERSYDVRIEAGLLARAGAALAHLANGRPMPIVTDENLRGHLPGLQASLRAAGIASEAIVLPAGEGTKSWANLEKVTDSLLELGVERSDHIIAFGGGVIGDLTGFAASILKRGCNFVQFPTTLLSQVDSSVGGKTAINSAAGKNLVGAFHQPALVLIDPDLLDTLPARQVRAGYAEVVKYGLIDDFAFFEWCEANAAALLDGDAQTREHA
ncbi:MAG: shikimate kinase, partial [Sphingomonadales bacterium]